MTIHHFSTLDEMEQLEAFWEGSFIGERQDGEYRLVCKQIDDFYVDYLMLGEVYKNMRIFKNPDLLQPYLDQMPLNL